MSAAPLLDRAVANNAAWCAAVCRVHGVPSHVADGVWRASGDPPPYYPRVVTLRPALAASRVAATVTGFDGAAVTGLDGAAVTGLDAAAVKDSYADVDLAPHGFGVLLDAVWVAREPVPAGWRRPAALGWERVSTEAALRDWCTGQGDGQVFPVALVGEPGVVVLGARRGNQLVGGAMVLLAARVAGVSNVWAAERWVGEVWAGLPGAVAEVGPGAPVVGYERGTALEVASGAGFHALGPLRVWRAEGGTQHTR